MKKVLNCTVIVMICVIFSISIFAARDVSRENDMAADLREFGLFSGVSQNNFDLERAPTRTEVLVMLIRVLGVEDEAKNGVWAHPFTDVPEWAYPYVGYAYQNGLTQGVSKTKFGTGTASATTYLTFMLRALGYSDENNLDFKWDNPFDLAKEVGILPDMVDTQNFWRADIVTISYAALGAKLKGSDKTLAEKLIEDGVFTNEAFREYYNVNKLTAAPTVPETPSTPGALTSQQIYEKCSPAVFYIEVYDANEDIFATGSGFFISETGIAVTNHHVMEDAYYAAAGMAGLEEAYEITGVYAYDEAGDWAIIQVDGEGKKFPYLDICDTPLKGGENIFTIGSPEGLENTISTGVVSNPSRIIGDVEYIQISAPISHGSSGGALINEFGQVIGITSAGLDEGQNLNFARPISCISGADTSTLYPLPMGGPSNSAGLAHVEYSISATSLTVDVGATNKVSVSSTLYDVPNDVTVTHSHKSSDESVATATWGDEENQPWSLNITGHKAGNAVITVYNDYTDDHVDIYVTVSAPAAGSVRYDVSVSSVSVTKGSTSTFTLTTYESNIPDDFDLTYYIGSYDEDVATVEWGDEDDQPWSVIVTGVGVGTTQVRIRNNYNSDIIEIPVTVTAPVAANGWQALKNYLIKNGEYSSKYDTYSINATWEEYLFTLEYDAEYDSILIVSITETDSLEILGMLSIKSNGSTYFASVVTFTDGTEIEGYVDITPSTYTENTRIYFDEYEGAPALKESFTELTKGLIDVSLTAYKTFFAKSGVSLYDLGFKSFQ